MIRIVPPQARQVSISALTTPSERRLQVRLEPLIQPRWLAALGRVRLVVYRNTALRTGTATCCFGQFYGSDRQIFEGYRHSAEFPSTLTSFQTPKSAGSGRA